MSSSIGGIREAFAPFYDDPDRTKLKNLLKDNLGEFNHLDYKESMIEPAKLAKIIIAMANTKGGAIIFGVKELEDKTYESVGLENFEDKTSIQQKLKIYLSENLKFEILDFAYTESEYDKLKGKKFQVILVHDLPKYIPFLPEHSGEGLYENRIYYRANTNVEEATSKQIQEMLSRRTSAIVAITPEETFKNDLFQLKKLYGQIPKNYTISKFDFNALVSMNTIFFKSEKNPNYPEESYDEFIAKMIERKKVIIEGAVMNSDIRGL